MTAARTCAECGAALAEDANPLRRYCSARCRYAYRDKQPERRAADNARHRARYHTDAEHRDRHRQADRDRYRTRVGIPLDAPLQHRRPAIEDAEPLGDGVLS